MLLDRHLIRIRLCLASVWPLRLRTVRAQEVVAFVTIQGAARAMPFLDLSCHITGYFPGQYSHCFFIAAVIVFDLLAKLIDSSRLWSGWMFIVGDARYRLPFLICSC